MTNMQWPQWVVLALMFMSVGSVLAKWGQPKIDRYDWIDLLAKALLAWLLWMGGFFG